MYVSMSLYIGSLKNSSLVVIAGFGGGRSRFCSGTWPSSVGMCSCRKKRINDLWFISYLLYTCRMLHVHIYILFWKQIALFGGKTQIYATDTFNQIKHKCLNHRKLHKFPSPWKISLHRNWFRTKNIRRFSKINATQNQKKEMYIIRIFIKPYRSRRFRADSSSDLYPFFLCFLHKTSHIF